MAAHERPPGRTLLAVTAGLLLIAGPAGCGGDSDRSPASKSSPISTTQPSNALRTIAEWDEQDGDEPTPMEPGTYRIPASPWSVTDFTVTFPEGWTSQYGHVYATNSGEPDELGFYAVVVDEIFTDSCAPEDESKQAVGPHVDDLYTALRKQAGGAAVSEPVSTTLGGYPATRIDLKIPKQQKVSECRMAPAGLQIWYSEPADKYFVLLHDATASVYVVDVDGQRQVFLSQSFNSASAADRAELQTVLDSIRIDGSSPTPEALTSAPVYESPGPEDHPISTYDAGGALLLITVRQWDEVGTATVWRKDPGGWRRIGALEHAVPQDSRFFPYFTSLHPGLGSRDIVAYYLAGGRVGYSSDGGATWTYLAEPRECAEGQCSYLYHAPEYLYLDTQGEVRRAAFGATSWETVRLPGRTASLAGPLGEQLLSVKLDCDHLTNHYWVSPDHGDSWSARRDFPSRTCLIRPTAEAAYVADADETQWWRSTDLVHWAEAPADAVDDEFARERFGACPGSSGRDPAPGHWSVDSAPVRFGDVVYKLFNVSERDANARQLELRVSHDDCRTWRAVLR